MHFKIDKKVLDKKIDIISNAVDPVSINPALKGILFEVQNKKIILTASNQELSIQIEIEDENLDIEKSGNMLIPASLLKEIVKKLEGIIDFKLENNQLVISTKEDRFFINLLEIKDFPQIEFTKFGDAFEIDADVFRSLIKNTIFAAAPNDNLRKIFQYVNFKAKDGVMTITATDSHRLAREVLSVDEKCEFDVSISVRSLKNLLPKEIFGKIKFYIEDKRVNVEQDGCIIQTKVFEGIYIDVEKVFQTEWKYALTISKREMNNVLSKASLLTSETYSSLTLEMAPEKFVISNSRKDIGSSSFNISKDKFSFKGEPITIFINIKFLKEAISVFEDDITLFINKEKNRILILSKSNEKNKQIVTPQLGHM